MTLQLSESPLDGTYLNVNVLPALVKVLFMMSLPQILSFNPIMYKNCMHKSVNIARR